jgi:hypothetical protein
VAGKLKVVGYDCIRMGVRGLTLLTFLEIEISIQININTEISITINTDTGVFHCVFI